MASLLPRLLKLNNMHRWKCLVIFHRENLESVAVISQEPKNEEIGLNREKGQ
jgi:hypothetical protein